MSPMNKEQVLRMNLLVGSYADVEHEVKRVVEKCFGRYGEYTYTLSKFESDTSYIWQHEIGGGMKATPTRTSYSVTATAVWLSA